MYKRQIDQWEWRRLTGRKGALKEKLRKALEDEELSGAEIDALQQEFFRFCEDWDFEKEERDARKKFVAKYVPNWEPVDQKATLLPVGGHRYYAQLKSGVWVPSL